MYDRFLCTRAVKEEKKVDPPVIPSKSHRVAVFILPRIAWMSPFVWHNWTNKILKNKVNRSYEKKLILKMTSLILKMTAPLVEHPAGNR
jgi:hypothetical protein